MKNFTLQTTIKYFGREMSVAEQARVSLVGPLGLWTSAEDMAKKCLFNLEGEPLKDESGQ